MTRRRVALVAVLGIVALVVAGGALAATGRIPIGASAGALATPHFVDVTAASGVDLTYDGPYPFAVGGGVAVLDCDEDGKPDLYLAGGAGPAVLERNDGSAGSGPHFTSVHDAATDLTNVLGAYPVDIDGDGQVDLAVLREGGNVLLRGLGGCRFERANEVLGFDGGNRITTAFSATWERPDSLPTLAFGNYILDPDVPDPDHLCADNVLVRAGSDGSRYGTAVPLTPSWCAQSLLFSDWDRSGRRDLRVSNDRQYYSDLSDGQEQLWRVAPGETPRLYTADDGWVPIRLNGMGIASYDVTGDGYPDAYLTSQGANVFQTLSDGPSHPAFRNIALELGVEATRPSRGGDPLPSTSWHPGFADVNDDGFVDLFVSKGNVGAQADYAVKDPSDLFMGGPSGTFTEDAEAAGIDSFARARGSALVDLDGDGMLDLVVVNFGDPVRIWRNVGSGTAAAPRGMGHWLGVKVRQPGVNGDAVGAWLDIEVGGLTTHREVTVGGGHAGGELVPIHVGLGGATTARVRVTWPDRVVGSWIDVKADRTVMLERDATVASPWPSLRR
ncbi:MAG: CRTAC1 family protein [Chloroflexota bacterium]